MWYLVGLLILIGIIVIYISLNDKTEEKKADMDYKSTDFYQELKNIEIKNEDIKKLKKQLSEYIIGMDNLVNSIIVSIFSGGHILVEGVPGLAKTRTILVFSKLLGLDFKRIQFTPDMLPMDIIGGEIYNRNTGKFEIFKGPIFTNLLLADEINRATPKVQSALLEAMQEKKVTIGNQTFPLEKPFFVMATQNPIEQEGTFPLPEAQLDRFLFKVVVNYPSFEEELKVMDVYDKDLNNIENIFTKEEILSIQERIKKINIPEEVKRYIVKLVEITRQKDEYITIGASTRAIIALQQASRVIAYIKGKDEVDSDDVKAVTLPVLRHRVKPSYKAIQNKIPVEKILIEKFAKVKDI